MSLQKYLSSDYIKAANTLKGGRRCIVAYVESYDDVAFWSQVLRQWETPDRYFEVMLPSRSSLAKGKKIALSHELGPELIACVDADYDWLMQGSTPTSKFLCESPYVLHTHAYAIENLQCFARGLHEVCVKATLNDRHVFPFAQFLTEYSETVWPLFVWSVWAYRYDRYKRFSLSDFARIATSLKIDVQAPQKALDELRKQVNKAVTQLQHRFPEGRKTYAPLRQQMLDMGITPQDTYLYMRGHDLMDNVILPLVEDVCNRLRRQREREISSLACHSQQKQNELSAYRRACASPQEMIRKYSGYTEAPPYLLICAQAAQLFATDETDGAALQKTEETR